MHERYFLVHVLPNTSSERRRHSDSDSCRTFFLYDLFVCNEHAVKASINISYNLFDYCLIKQSNISDNVTNGIVLIHNSSFAKPNWGALDALRCYDCAAAICSVARHCFVLVQLYLERCKACDTCCKHSCAADSRAPCFGLQVTNLHNRSILL